MDMLEVSDKRINRHPWELSRTFSLLNEWIPYIKSFGDNASFIDLGAGDMFFDRFILKTMPDHVLHAIDIGYNDEKMKYIKVPKSARLYKTLDEFEDDNMVDYAIMMDSLEIFPDTISIVRFLSEKVKMGGVYFFYNDSFPVFVFRS